jgi:hypothetical protein
MNSWLVATPLGFWVPISTHWFVNIFNCMVWTTSIFYQTLNIQNRGKCVNFSLQPPSQVSFRVHYVYVMFSLVVYLFLNVWFCLVLYFIKIRTFKTGEFCLNLYHQLSAQVSFIVWNVYTIDFLNACI